MLLGNADIEAAAGKFLGEEIKPGAGRHGRGDGDDFVVLPGLRNQRLGKHFGVGRRAAGLRLRLGAGRDVELDHAMVFVGRTLGRRVAFTFRGDNMQ